MSSNQMKIAKVDETIYKNPSYILKLSKILTSLKQFYTNEYIVQNFTEQQLSFTIYVIRSEMEVIYFIRYYD